MKTGSENFFEAAEVSKKGVLNTKMEEKERSSFTGSLGFVLAAAGSAVGLGNIWRFPYFAAKNDGGLFLTVYIILAITFGFTLLMTEVALGRKTKASPLKAYGIISKKWKWIGYFAVLVPFIIMPYYCAIGGWVLKYCLVYLTGQGEVAAESSLFTGFITDVSEPLTLMAAFVFMTSFIIYRGIDKGIEKMSKILMPILLLLVIGIALFSLTISYTDGNVTRTGLEGLAVYCIPEVTDVSFAHFMNVVLDAMGQLFFSISVAMGIMVAYGSYFRDNGNIAKSVIQIEFFDTLVAFLAGVMIILPLYVFMGREGMSASGPSLVFITMPKIFSVMGSIGSFIGVSFFVMVFFAALTSCVSIMEAVVSSFMEGFKISRKHATVLEGIIAFVLGAVVCLGYNVLYFEMPMPGGSTGQILDIMDYVSNNFLMPVVAICTCLLIGWVSNPKEIVGEATKNGEKFYGKGFYALMMRFIAPILLVALLCQSLGILG